MMASLFSIFEPSSSIMSLPLNWSSSLLGLIFLPYMYWITPNRWLLIWYKTTQILHKEFKILLKPNFSSMSIIFVVVFTIIVYNNFLGLMPYVFTSSSHLVMTLSLSLPLWISYIIFGWMNNSRHMFAHLVPQGTPTLLMPFMVMIETISNIIRPGTLAVRLAANMIAGHLLLTLLGNTGPKLALFMILILIMCQILLLILESAVAIIQSYVFAVLSTLYASETY